MAVYTDSRLLDTKGGVARLPLPALRRSSERLSSGQSSNSVRNVHLVAASAPEAPKPRLAPIGRFDGKDVQEAANQVVERRGVEPLTFRLPA